MTASAGAILALSSRKLEVVAQNISNITTPGYRARSLFSSILMSNKPSNGDIPLQKESISLTAGQIKQTASQYDLATGSQGFFVVRNGDDTFYTRDGQFIRDASGRLTTAGGYILQGSTGDIRLQGTRFEVMPDGQVLDDGAPAGHVLVVKCADGHSFQPGEGGMFRSSGGVMAEVALPDIRQGALEMSNVNTAHEMISMMSALRSAETAQRIIQVYDDLTGRSITAFGQS